MVFTAFYVSTRIIINNHKYKAQKCFKLLCPGYFFRPRKFKMALKKSSLLIESFVKKNRGARRPEGFASNRKFMFKFSRARWKKVSAMWKKHSSRW